MRTDTKKSHIHRQRHGNHQKRTGKFLKVYTPYLPLILLITASIFLSLKPAQSSSSAKPETKSNNSMVLAYATDTSVSGLLGSTNQQRSSNGIGSLSVNSKLNAAAQAKANDMVTRDYWSHNTPDGSPPWVFITNASYSYSRAGENLAYGYATSADTIEGWMGSPTHRANLLDGNFVEVGFGIANSADFIGSPDDKAGYPHVGNQTIVVAMYAAPYVAPAPAPTPKTPASTAPATTTPTPPATTPQPEVPSSATSQDSTSNDKEDKKKEETVKTINNTDAKVLSDDSTTFNRLQTMTGNALPWLGSVLFVLSLSGGLIVLGKHGFAFHNFVLKGERYVLQHTLFDMTVISLIGFTYIATRSVGVIL
ncbi:MAG: hypothetical protein QG628_488 [Patescibacteria group bacterium]|nr:hypothetical protein [Patescibacteria group bacterium]